MDLVADNGSTNGEKPETDECGEFFHGLDIPRLVGFVNYFVQVLSFFMSRQQQSLRYVRGRW